MWNILNKNRCETLADIFRDSIKFKKDYLDGVIKILLSDYKDSLEAGDLICISRGSLYYLSWIEENSIINEREYSKNEKQYYMEAMEWLGYTLQSWYEDFGITGKDICSKLKKEDFEWLISNWSILHTQDTKYVLEEARTTRKINF